MEFNIRYMKKLFIVLIILAKINLIASAAQGLSPCNKLKKKTEIEFYSSYGKLIYDQSNNQRQLTQLGEKYGIVEHGLFASGLATVGVNYQVSIDATAQMLENGKYCVVPEKIKVYIGYQNPTIYMASDLREGSCEQNIVKRHEQTHQQINITALEYFLPKFQKSVRAILKGIEPQLVNSEEQIEPSIQSQTEVYLKKIEPLVNFFKAELLKEQGKLDRTENYQFEGNLCRYYKSHH